MSQGSLLLPPRAKSLHTYKVQILTPPTYYLENCQEIITRELFYITWVIKKIKRTSLIMTMLDSPVNSRRAHKHQLILTHQLFWIYLNNRSCYTKYTPIILVIIAIIIIMTMGIKKNSKKRGEIVPVWTANFPREIIPISEMLLKARIGTAGRLLMGLFIRRRQEVSAAARWAAPHYKLVMQIHSL